MSEQLPGTPAPANNPQGTGSQPEQPQQPPQNPAAPQPANPPAAPTPPPAQQTVDVAALQRKLEQTEQSMRHFQSQFSQERNKVQALTGAQPQVDPIAERAARLTQAGIDKDDAVILARAFQTELAPLQQQNQQFQAALQGNIAVDQVMQAASQQAQGAFQHPLIAQQVYENLRQVALSGDHRYLTPEYAIYFADGLLGQMYRTGQLNGAPAAPAQQPAPRPMGGWNGPMAGYSPVPPATPPRPLGADAYDREIAERFGIKPNQ